MSDKAGGPPKGGPIPPAAPAALAPTLPAPAAAPAVPLFPAPPPFAKKAVPVSPHFDGDVLSLSARAAEAEPPAWAAAAAPEPPEYAERLSFGSQIQTYVGTTWATFVSSVVAPTAAGIGIAALFFVALGGSIAGSDLISAATSQSIAPLMQGRALQMLAISSAAGALVVAVWSLKDYLFAGRRYLLDRLTKNIPKDEATLARTPAAYVRFYHGVLRWCGAFAFLCEVVFQLFAFAIITWGIAVGFPGFALFKNPEQLSVMNTLLFWVEDAFAIVDGPETLGIAMSPLDPNKTIWAFGLTLIFFKIGVVGLILQLVRTSFTLRPGDISLAWQRAYEREDP
jgi:hypothetical protein